MVEATKKIGKGSEYYLIHVKGQPSIEPFRIPKGWGLGVSTSPVAGRHLRGAIRGPGHSGPGGTDYDIIHYHNQAKAVVWQAKTKELEDNLGICNYVGTWSGAHFLTPANYAEWVRSALGLPVSEEDLMEHYAVIGRNLEKAFNTRHTNFTREDDLPPLRFRREEVPKGPYQGFKADEDQYNAMLDEFYQLWGWDRKTGMQTREGLEKLGLQDVAEMLAGKCLNEIISQLVDRNLDAILARDRKESPIAPQAPAGYPLSLIFRPMFRKAQRRRKKRISEERRTPPPRLRRNARLVVASNRAFLPGP